MPKPHAVMQREIKLRLKGKSGKSRIDEINKILSEMPPFKDGPYGKLRKDLLSGITEVRRKESVVYHDTSFEIKKEGLRLIGIVGMPNSGKSSILNALTGSNSKTGDYSFTTTSLVSGAYKWNSACIQLVDLPGIIEGASSGVGIGKRLFSVIRNTDIILLTLDLSNNYPKQFSILENELSNSRIFISPDRANPDPGEVKKCIVLGNKCDLVDTDTIESFKSLLSKYTVIVGSALHNTNTEKIKDTICEVAGLIYIHYKNPRKELEPLVVDKGSKISDIARRIHRNLLDNFRFAKVWGKSAKFPGQMVGLNHEVLPEDTVEILAK